MEVGWPRVVCLLYQRLIAPGAHRDSGEFLCHSRDGGVQGELFQSSFTCHP